MTPSPAPPSLFRRSLFSAPHRLGFLAGAAQLVLVMVFWFLELAGRAGFLLSTPLVLSVPAPWAHGWLMIYGLFPFFIYGFLFTVFPRWSAGPVIGITRYGPVFALAVSGMAIVYAGLYTHMAVFISGVLLYLAAWVVAIAVLIAAYRSGARRGWHERLLLAALGVGATGVGVFVYGLAASQSMAVIFARDLGLWGFLVPVLLIVAHRIIPFFTQSAIPFKVASPGAWSLPVLVGGSIAHGVFEITALPLARLVVDLGLAGVVVHHSVRWGFTKSLRIRLLAMLHIAFLWFGFAMLLYALDAALVLLGTGTLGRAPLHALGIGFITGVLVAMATRVTLGHSGRPLVTDGWTWHWFVALNAVALTRMAAEVVPADAYLVLNLLAAGGWLACLAPWAARYSPIYWRPRVDDAQPAKVSLPQRQ
jgi:uncharacterized protein involved in response to NO